MASLDLSKAFDCVDRRILLTKLSHYGIEHPWHESYLSGRRQYVRICNDVKGNVLSGVPQGSVLSPMLFNLYVSGYCLLCILCLI